MIANLQKETVVGFFCLPQRGGGGACQAPNTCLLAHVLSSLSCKEENSLWHFFWICDYSEEYFVCILSLCYVKYVKGWSCSSNKRSLGRTLCYYNWLSWPAGVEREIIHWWKFIFKHRYRNMFGGNRCPVPLLPRVVIGKFMWAWVCLAGYWWRILCGFFFFF